MIWPSRSNVERLDEIVERAALHRLDRGVGGAVRGDEDDRPFRVERVNVVEQVEAGAIGELDVEHDNVGVVLANRFESLGRRRRGEDGHPLLAEDAAKGVADGFFVVDDQQRARHPRHL